MEPLTVWQRKALINRERLDTFKSLLDGISNEVGILGTVIEKGGFIHIVDSMGISMGCILSDYVVTLEKLDCVAASFVQRVVTTNFENLT